MWLATVLAILLAILYGWHTVRVPIGYDSEGYRQIAQDIRTSGVFSKFRYSELRTYGYPALLSLVLGVAETVGWLEAMTDGPPVPRR